MKLHYYILVSYTQILFGKICCLGIYKALQAFYIYALTSKLLILSQP